MSYIDPLYRMTCHRDDMVMMYKTMRADDADIEGLCQIMEIEIDESERDAMGLAIKDPQARLARGLIAEHFEYRMLGEDHPFSCVFSETIGDLERMRNYSDAMPGNFEFSKKRISAMEELSAALHEFCGTDYATKCEYSLAFNRAYAAARHMQAVRHCEFVEWTEQP